MGKVFLLSSLCFLAVISFAQPKMQKLRGSVEKANASSSIGRVADFLSYESVDSIIRNVKGDIKPYLSACNWQIGSYGGYDESYLNQVCFADAGKTIYIRDLVPYVTDRSWVKGEINNGIATIPSGQWVSTTETGEKWYIGGFVRNEQTEEFTPVDEYQFKLSDNGNILEQEDLSGQKVYVIGYSENGDILSIQSDNKLTYFDKELVQLPSNAKTTAYNMVYYIEGSKSPNGSLARVAFLDDGSVYMQGLCPYIPKSWAKGTFDGKTIKIPTGQYVGQSGNYVQCIYTYSIDGNGNENATDFIEFTLKDGKKSMRAGRKASVKTGFINSMETIDMEIENISYTDAELKPSKPSAPILGSYDKENGRLYYSIPYTDINDKNMDTDSLTWRLYIDGKPYVFTKKEFAGLETDMSEIPYGYSDLSNFWFDSDSGMNVLANFFVSPDKSIAIESVYRLDGVANVSERSTLQIGTGIEAATSRKPAVKSVVYTDISGKVVAKPHKGLYIVTTTFVDGTKEISKIVR